MGSYTFSDLLEMIGTKFSFLRRSGKGIKHTDQASAPRLSRKRDLLLAFLIVSLPLLVISILLLAFIFLLDREIPASYAEIPALPFFRIFTAGCLLHESGPWVFPARRKLGK